MTKTWCWYIVAFALVILLAGVPNVGFAADLPQQLTQMEQQLFARTYPMEPSGSRLDRLEASVFGATQPNMPQEQRVQALNQFFQSPQSEAPALTFRQSPPPAPMTSSSQTPSPVKSNRLPDIVPTESEYPVVGVMEEKVFRRTFQQESVENRLSRLESRILGSPQKGSLQERTDQLRIVVLGDTTGGSTPGNDASRQIASSDEEEDSSGMTSAPTYQDPQQAESDILQALPAIEKKILKRTFPQESVSDRLSRLEMKLFNTPAPELSPEDRFYRIVSVANAKSYSRRENAYGGPSSGSGSSSGGGGSSMGAWGSMLLMILMSLI